MKGVEAIRIRDVSGGALIAVKVVPGASRDRLVGPLGDCLKVATAAPPEKGKANTAVVRLLAKALAVEARTVTLQTGPAAPRKEFLIAALTAAAVRQKLRDA